MGRLVQLAQNHSILFGTLKFSIGLVIGFGLGIYYLPILVAEKGLSETELSQLSGSAATQGQSRSGTFVKDLPGSDAFHWGEGKIFVTQKRIWLDGALAPGPDYRLYMTKGHIQTKAEFLKVKSDSLQIAPVKAYKNFSLEVPDGVNLAEYDGVLIWCEAFSMFITSAAIR